MEKKFENRDFEHFVKQNADQYRMFPSEKVWKGINNTLHTRRRWYGAGLALLLLTTATVTGIMLSPSSKKQQVAETANAGINSTENKQIEKTEPIIVIAPVKSSDKKATTIISPDNTQKNLFESTAIVESDPATLSTSLVLPEESFKAEKSTTKDIEPVVFTKPIALRQQTISNQPNFSATKTTLTPANDNNLSIINNNVQTEIVISEPVIEKEAVSAEKNTIKEDDTYPMTIESIVNAYKRSNSAKKVAWHLYITPSVTYRKLIENKPFLEAASASAGVPAVTNFSSINNIVTHKPDIGLQFGIAGGYPLSKAITLTAGLQFNLSKYNIQASDHSNEVATIALSAPNGRPNTVVSTVTNLRNVGGYRASWLHNKYISASIPLGAEVKLSGKNKTIIGVGATIQPTYVLGNRAYLLSTDFKNYAEVPSLTRKWNINTGFELFAGYNTGKVDWRIGPQFRYQLFSSFYDSYPIKEHLFDFGIKLGVTLK